MHNTFYDWIDLMIFSATVTNLQQKLESNQTTNALMKEDLAISKNTILTLQEENDQLMSEKGNMLQDAQKQLEVVTKLYNVTLIIYTVYIC